MDGAPGQVDRRRQLQIDRRPADMERDPARLDDPAVIDPGIRELLGVEGERDRAALPGIEADAGETEQLDDGARDFGLLIADVQLDHFVAGAIAGVRHVDTDDAFAAGGRDFRPVDPQVRQLEGGVRQAEPERPQRPARAVDVVALRTRAAAGWVVAIRDRDLSDMVRDRDGQLAARVLVADEDVDDGGWSPVAWDPGEQDRRAMAGGPVQGKRPAADDDQHDRRSRRDDGLQELLLPAEEPELAAIAEFAGRRVVRQPGSFADHDDRDVGIPAATTASRILGIAPVARCRSRGHGRPRCRPAVPGSRRGSSAGRRARLEARTPGRRPPRRATSPPCRISCRVCMWTRWL